MCAQLQQKLGEQTAAAEWSSAAARDLLAASQSKVDYWTEQASKLSSLKAQLDGKLSASTASAAAAQKETEVELFAALHSGILFLGVRDGRKVV